MRKDVVIEIRKASADQSSSIIRCIDTPSNNWARLRKGELGLTDKTVLSDCWEPVEMDIRENGILKYSTDESINVEKIPEGLIQFVVAYNNEHKSLPSHFN